MSKARPRVLAILPVFGPSTTITVLKPFVRLHRAGRISAKITLEAYAKARDLERADLVVFSRNTEPNYARWLDLVQQRGIPFIYDLDDNFYELSLDTELGRHHRAPERIELLDTYLSAASLVRVYSRPLLERGRTLNARTEKVAGPVDLCLIGPPAPPTSDGKVRLVYATSRSQDELAAIFEPALRRVLREYAGRVEMTFWGYNPAEWRDQPGVRMLPITLNYDRFLRNFSRMGFDIGLAPLLNDIFHRSKTNNKFREYGASHVAGIYSDVDVYADSVQECETGMLVANETDAWYRALTELIEDAALRARIKRQARLYVERHHSQEQFEEVWWTQIKQVLAERSDSSCSDLPRLAVTQKRPVSPAFAAPLSAPPSLPRKIYWAFREGVTVSTHESNPKGLAPFFYRLLKDRSVTFRLIAHAPRVIYRMGGQGRGTLAEVLRRYRHNLWMSIKLRYSMSPAASIGDWWNAKRHTLDAGKR